MADEDLFKLNEEEKPFEPRAGEKRHAVKPRDAATLILVRNGREVMMGQRAKGHVFMPDKWVFPGGKVEPGDARAKAATELNAETDRLLRHAVVRQRAPRAYALAAARETHEETGLQVGSEAGPELDRFSLIARAITPPYRPRRFDARFFMADASVLSHDEPAGGDELLDVRWFTLDQAFALDLPSITKFVLKEVQARLAGEAKNPPFLRFLRGSHQIERLT